MCFLPTDAAVRERLRGLLERTVVAEGQQLLGWRDVPVRPEHTGEVAGACRPDDPPAVRRAPVRPSQARPGRVRAQAVRDPPGLRADGGGGRPVRHLELVAHDQLQGHADLLPAGRVLPGPARRAHKERAGARALALLHQHVPELGARASLPRDLPQRRDQHGDGQHQLDARARVGAALRAVRRGPRRRSSRSSAPATRTRRRSTTCSSC